MTKKILIAGYYGFSNTGDEAILSSMLCDMRSIHPDLEFTVISGNPKETSCRYNVTAILWTDIISMIDAAREADLILLGGGGLFHDYWGIDANNILTRQHVGIPFYSGIPILALLNDKPFMIYSVGVGPLLTEEGKRLTSLSFKIADIATLRDNDSLNLLHAIGVQRKDLKVTADPTFRLRMKIDKGNEILTKIRMEQSGPLVGVCLRNWDFGVKPEIWQQEVAKALDQFVQNYRAVLLFIPFQTLAGSLTDDIAVIKNVAGMIHNKKGIMILEEEYLPEEISGILNGCDIVLGMRLHSIMMAINNLVPTIGLEYDPKIGNLMKRMGLNSYLISITSLKSDDLFTLLERIWYEKAQIKLQIAKQILKLQEQANENAVLAIDLLEHGRKRQIKPSEFDFIKELALQKIIQIENKEQAIHSATIQLREKEQSIQSMDAHLIQKDQLIRSLSIQVQDISRENHLLTARLTEQEAKIQTMDAHLIQKDQLIRSLSIQVQDISRENHLLTARLIEQKAKLKVAEHEIRDISGRLEENEIKLHNAYNKINALSAKLIESDSTLEQIRSNYEIVRDRLEEIEKSTAWKIVRVMWAIRLKLLPHGSRRELLGRDAINIARKLTNINIQNIIINYLSHLQDNLSERRRLNIMRRKFSQIVRKHREAKEIIFFAPSVEWDLPLFQRPQQMALAFARKNALVFYCEPTLINIDADFVEVAPRLYRCNLQPEFKRIMKSPIVIVFSYNKHWLDYFDNPIVIYEMIDELSVFPYEQERLRQDHLELCQNAKLVVTTAKRLYDQVWPIRPDVILCQNGVDYEHFAQARVKRANPPDAMRPFIAEEKPIIGYYGALAQWFDYGLLREVAQIRPDYQFILIGPNFDGSLPESQILNVPNVHWIGAQKYQELPNYLAYFDVAMIPFLLNEITHATSPLKLFEYMAGGKPVVITPMHESMHYEGVLAGMTPQEFARRLDEALKLKDDPVYLEMLDRVAKENTWDKRSQKILEALKNINYD